MPYNAIGVIIMENSINEKRTSLVIKSNDLITKSRFTLNAQQQKIILYLISQINQKDKDFNLYEFNIKEFCRVCGIKCEGGSTYQFLKEQIKVLSDKSLWIELEDGRETLVRWIEKPYIDKKNGIIKIKLDRDMKPYLLELKKNFTKYELVYTLNFKSKYAIRLYELIKSRHYRELYRYSFTMEIEEFKTRIGADNKYDRFNNFHIRALKPAIDEINQYSDKHIEYDLIYKGRKVVEIDFTITTQDIQTRLNNALLLETKENKSDEQ